MLWIVVRGLSVWERLRLACLSSGASGRVVMLINRTTGSASVVPELVYVDVEQAVDWLCAAFGFTELWRAGGHRARIAFGNGVLIVADADPDYGRAAPKRDEPHCGSVLVKVDDVDAHHDRARQHGARILGPPRDYPYGERQYSAEDLGGHRWTFTQAIADLAPEDWGGTSASALTDGSGGQLSEPL
jgi:uncharacterized glyoxalase superfamily protein PhnB